MAGYEQRIIIPEIEGVDLARVQTELGVDGAYLGHLADNPYFAGDPTDAVIYETATGAHGVPADNEGLEAHIRWHYDELALLEEQGIGIPPTYSAIVDNGVRSRLLTVVSITGTSLWERLVVSPFSIWEQTSKRRQRPVVALGEAILRYYTTTDRPEGQPVIAGIGFPTSYALKKGRLMLRAGSMPAPASAEAELRTLGNWVRDDLRITPETTKLAFAIEDVIRQAR